MQIKTPYKTANLTILTCTTGRSLAITYFSQETYVRTAALDKKETRQTRSSVWRGFHLRKDHA